MTSQINQLKHVIAFYAFLFVVWGFYRALFKFPTEVEELVLKPLIWLLPTLYLVRKEGAGLASLGFSGKNLFKSLYLAVGLGILFAVVAALANVAKYQGEAVFSLPAGIPVGSLPLLAALGVSLATAVSEETVFRGFIFSRLWKVSRNELWANIITTLAWAIIHLPVLVFVYKLGAYELGVQFFLTSLLGFGSAFIFARTQNILSPILLHVFWTWPIILFR